MRLYFMCIHIHIYIHTYTLYVLYYAKPYAKYITTLRNRSYARHPHATYSVIRCSRRLYTYIYIYIYREREREREIIHIDWYSLYIYIYIPCSTAGAARDGTS